MLKLKLQYSGHLMQRANALERIPMLGKIEGKRRRGQQRMMWLDSRRQRHLACCSPRSVEESDTAESLNSNNMFCPN